MDIVIIKSLTYFGLIGAYFFIGALWYSDRLFGKVWSRAHGLDLDNPDTVHRMKSRAPTAYIQSAVSLAVLVILLATILDLVGVQGPGEGLLIAFSLWVGFVAPVTIMNSLFVLRGLVPAVVDAGYHLVGMCIAGLVLGSF